VGRRTAGSTWRSLTDVRDVALELRGFGSRLGHFAGQVDQRVDAPTCVSRGLEAALCVAVRDQAAVSSQRPLEIAGSCDAGTATSAETLGAF
jgi:hypothetical protein